MAFYHLFRIMKKLQNRLAVMIIMLACAVVFASGARAAEVLTWDECVREASAHHPDLVSASESVKQAEAQRDIVKGGLYPSITGSLGAGRLTTGGSSPSDSWSYWINAQQLLFDGSKTANQVDAAAENVRGSRYSADVVSSSTRYALRSAFVGLLKAQQLVSLTEDIAGTRRQNYRLIDLRYKSGREHRGSLSKAFADKAQAEFEVTQAKRNLELAQVQLSTVMGRERLTPIAVSGKFVIGESVDTLPDFAKIVEGHPSYRLLASKKEANRFSLEAAKAVLMPTLALTTSAGNNVYSQLQDNRPDWQAGLSLSVPIYTGGTGRATEAKALAALNQLDADGKSSWFSLQRALQQSWKTLRDAADNVEIQKNFLDAAIERAKIADAQYSAGLVAFNEWIIIADNLVSSKKSFLNAQADLMIAEAQWIQAKGGTLEIR